MWRGIDQEPSIFSSVRTESATKGWNHRHLCSLLGIFEIISYLDFAVLALYSSGQVWNCKFWTQIKLCPVALHLSVVEVIPSFLSDQNALIGSCKDFTTFLFSSHSLLENLSFIQYITLWPFKSTLFHCVFITVKNTLRNIITFKIWNIVWIKAIQDFLVPLSLYRTSNFC